MTRMALFIIFVTALHTGCGDEAEVTVYYDCSYTAPCVNDGYVARGTERVCAGSTQTAAAEMQARQIICPRQCRYISCSVQCAATITHCTPE